MMKRAPGDGAKAADDQTVAYEVVVVEDAFGDEMFRAIRIVIVGVVADLDVRIVDERLQEADPWLAVHRMGVQGIWSVSGANPFRSGAGSATSAWR
jgi:hypothetical protein